MKLMLFIFVCISPLILICWFTKLELARHGLYALVGKYGTTKNLNPWHEHKFLGGVEPNVKFGTMRKWTQYRAGILEEGIFLSFWALSWLPSVFPKLLIPWSAINEISIIEKKYALGFSSTGVIISIDSPQGVVTAHFRNNLVWQFLLQHPVYHGRLVLNGDATANR